MNDTIQKMWLSVKEKSLQHLDEHQQAIARVVFFTAVNAFCCELADHLPNSDPNFDRFATFFENVAKELDAFMEELRRDNRGETVH